MFDPLVTVICLCFNQKRFVAEALQSVLSQTYQPIELIVVDDGSTDGSAEVIRECLQAFPTATFLELGENLGTTRAFNAGLQLAKGEYIADLAGDDVFRPDRIQKQMATFEKLDASYGVVFSDALLIDENSQPIGTFYPRNPDGSLLNPVPQGNVYASILRSYSVCAPTILTRKSVYDALGGYDESLIYEDFDFFVRSARQYRYQYIDEPLTYYRKSAGSSSTRFYRKRYNPHLISTLTVCHKAYAQNQTTEENRALACQVRYFLRQSFFTENFVLVESYAALLRKLDKLDWISWCILQLARRRLPTSTLTHWYTSLRQAMN